MQNKGEALGMIETQGLGPGDAEALRDRVHAIVARPVDEHMQRLPASVELQAYRAADRREDIRGDAEADLQPPSLMDSARG